VDVGHERDAFLHYQDLGPHFRSFCNVVETAKKRRIFSFADFPRSSETKGASIMEAVTGGKVILVQVIKEAISTKGPRISTEISLTGRHIVLLPFERKVAVSQKIKNKEERRRLEQIVKGSLPTNYGAIVRTASQGVSDEDLASDVKAQVQRWKEILTKLETAEVPSPIMNETSRATTILRDHLSSDYSNIYIDDKETYEDIKDYIRVIEPDMEKIVKHYSDSEPILDHFEITRQIKALFGKIVSFKRKSYMVIEHTEALHVIDINSGPRVRNAASQEDIAMEVNCNAVEHIARQLRLRDMGGIIVIDFIDLHKAENRATLFNMMLDAMKQDRARHTILPLTKFGLMQITRQRVRPVARVNNSEQCPTCRGTGKIYSSILFDTEIENQISDFAEEMGIRYIKVKVHPYVAAYLKKGLYSLRLRWMMKYKCYIAIVATESIGYVEAKFYDRNNRILLKQSISDYELDMEENREIREMMEDETAV
ncbi:MAG: Rne/Rng family ribonuclease, partial [Rikenellaceae bacterium]